MNSKATQEKRDELKRLYFESAQINIHKKKLEEELLKRESATGNREKVARRRKGKRNSELPIVTIALLSGFSRDKVYRLLLSGELRDRHPVSVGRMIRSGQGFRKISKSQEEIYSTWKTVHDERKSHRRAARKNEIKQSTHPNTHLLGKVSQSK